MLSLMLGLKLPPNKMLDMRLLAVVTPVTVRRIAVLREDARAANLLNDAEPMNSDIRMAL
jgi:hypothetical protein